MEEFVEQILVYGIVFVAIIVTIFFYLRKQKRNSMIVEEKIVRAKLDGLYEPVSLHPVVDEMHCIKSGACITACPEKDILGIRNGKATTINASHCIGHGACFHACPTEAISLCIGTEKRGVELPHVGHTFETNVPGVYVAGELGGMGLIKNAVEQGRQAVDNINKVFKKNHNADYDLIVIGAGPAGISGALTAKKHGLKCIVLEQDTLGGTVFTFPRSKIVMTSPMDLPLFGKVKLNETSKSELLDLWHNVIDKNDIKIQENTKVDAIKPENGIFTIETNKNEQFTGKNILLAIGRRGTPRKLGVPGESHEKVAYRLLEPEDIKGKNILVVGGGDSAVESAMMLMDQNVVSLSYRSETFSRLKVKNSERIKDAISKGLIDMQFNTTVGLIEKNSVTLVHGITAERQTIANDLVFIFAGGELPTQFLQKIGINISKKFGEAILKHN